MDDEFMGVTETARRLGLHPNTVRNMASDGRLPKANLPGDRRLKFRASDVERLIADRGRNASSVVARVRSVEPELITGSELATWGGRVAQEKAPELVRRLLASTPGVTAVSVRAGDGVALSGWDGFAVSDGTAPFLPIGRLRFEIGTDASPGGKAERDYRNRLDLPAGEREDLHLVVVTTRRWRDKAAWVAEKSELHDFRGVTVLDADDLEGWLQASENVHIWLSETLGRFPRDVQSLDRWWNQFNTSTDPQLPAALFAIDRADVGEALRAMLRPEVERKVLTIRGVWADEVLATVYASLAHMQSPITAVIVQSAAAWSRLVESGSPLVLIPVFEDPNISSALGRGHAVILIATGEMQVRPGSAAVVLSPPGRSEAARVLRETGAGPTRAEKLAALYRRSPKAFVRALSLDPRATAPVPESHRADIPTIARLALAVQWSAGEGDQEILERLTQSEWSQLEGLLLSLEQSDDPIFIRAGESWRVAAPVETSLLLFGRLTARDLQSWSELVVETLLAADPLADLEPGERLAAQIRGIRRPHSTTIAEGLAQGLALMALVDDDVAGARGSDWSNTVVRNLLRRATGADGSASMWRRIAPILPLLAEAAPDLFLDAVLDDLGTDAPTLRGLFPVDEGNPRDLFAPTSSHVYLLWALQAVGRSKQHFDAAMDAMARLCPFDSMDPRSGDRAFSSLQNMLYPWVQYTDAGSEAKLAFIERLIRHEPSLAWRLMLGLLPTKHAFSMTPSRPRYRDWGPETPDVSPAEWGTFVGRLVELLIESAGQDLRRWTEVVPSLDDMHPRDFERAISALSGAVKGSTPTTPGARELWNALNSEVLRHREHADAHWALPSEKVRQLAEIAEALPEPGKGSEYAHLFGWRPHLEGIRRGDEAFRSEWARLQRDAIEEVLSSGDSELERLVEEAENPDGVGAVLADHASEAHDLRMLDWLLSPVNSRSAASRSYFFRRLATPAGLAWSQAALRELHGDPERQRSLALLLDPGEQAWDLLESIDPELASDYWLRMSPWRVRAEDARRALRELLAARRPGTALTLIDMTIMHAEDGEEPVFRAADVLGVLEAFFTGEAAEALGESSHRVAWALNFLEDRGVDSDVIARYEFLFYPLIENSERRPVALFRVLRERPSEFVGLVETVTRPRAGSGGPSDNAGGSALAWRVLNDWRELPGTDGTGWEPDPESLTSWVREARSLFAEKDRAQVGDEMIGTLLSAGGAEAPEGWPSVPVRDLLEMIGTSEMESGFYIGTRNARGMWSRGLYEGGQQEWALAERFAHRAEEARAWRRMNRVLRALAEAYERDARREDDEAKWDADEA